MAVSPGRGHGWRLPALEGERFAFLRVAPLRRRRGGCLGLQPWPHFPEAGGWGGQLPWPSSNSRATADSNTPSAARLWLYPAENGRSHLGRVSLKMTELPKVNRGNNHNRNFSAMFPCNCRPGLPELWPESPSTIAAAPTRP